VPKTSQSPADEAAAKAALAAAAKVVEAEAAAAALATATQRRAALAALAPPKLHPINLFARTSAPLWAPGDLHNVYVSLIHFRLCGS
jgi:hypothetical protein